MKITIRSSERAPLSQDHSRNLATSQLPIPDERVTCPAAAHADRAATRAARPWRAEGFSDLHAEYRHP